MQAKLQVDLLLSNLALAEEEVDLAKVRLRQLELLSPVDGKIYKFDVRLGESLTADDAFENRARVARPLGPPLGGGLLDGPGSDRRPLPGFDSETNAPVGQGEVIAMAPYLGRRNFRTEDDQERFDTKYLDVVLRLEEAGVDLPLGLSVVAVLPPAAEKKT